MSKILRRPMFRGGPVDSRGTGITSGLMDGGRVGLKVSFPGTVGQAQEFLTGGDIVDLSKTKFSAGMPFSYKTTPFENIKLTDTSVEEEETPKGDVLSRMTDYLDIDESSPFEGYENFEDLPKSVQNISSKTDFDRYKKEQSDEKDKAQSVINAEGFLPTPGPEKGVIGTDGKDGIKFVTGPTSNVEESTTIDPKQLMKENAELFKELLGEANDKKLKDARIQDASDYLLKFFEGSQKEGATVGSAAADVAAFATAKDSRTERAKAAIDKQDQTAVALSINDYIAGKRSKEQVEAMIAKSDLALSNKKEAIDYANRLTQGFSALPGFIADSKAIGYAGRVADGLRKSGLSQFPQEKVTSKEMEEQFEFNPETDTGKIFIETDTKTTYTLVSDGKGGYTKNIIDQG